MDRRFAAVGAVVLLLGAVVAIQILDPRLGEQSSPPEVDFSEPPNEVAADAAKQFEYVNYSYRVDIKYNERDEWRQYVISQVDHSYKAYKSVGPAGEKGTVIYGTSTTAFVRPRTDNDWEVMGTPEVTYPVKYLTHPMYAERLRESEANVVSENASIVTIRADVNPSRITGNFPGNATIIVNKTSGLIETLYVRYRTSPTDTKYLRLQVIKTGTKVERPKSIGFSFKEVFWDLLRGPLFRVDWML